MKYAHFRRKNKDGLVLARGGATLAYSLVSPNTYAYAVARCHENDNYCRATGRMKAEYMLRSPHLLETVEAANAFELRQLVYADLVECDLMIQAEEWERMADQVARRQEKRGSL